LTVCSNEVTAARQALATLKPHAALSQESAMEQGTESEGGEDSMTAEVMAKLTEMAATLTATRKRRGKAAPEHLTKVDSLKQFKQSASHIGLHRCAPPLLHRRRLAARARRASRAWTSRRRTRT